jgi:hypothetical protein
MENTTKSTEIKAALKDVFLYIVWGKFSNTYFGKSSSWLYNKFNGRDGNGGTGGFTDTEKLLLKNSLNEFADKIKQTAASIE